MNKGNKDVDIVIYETQEAIINLINGSGLPASVLKLMIGEIYNEVRYLAKDAYDKKLANINESSLSDQNPNNITSE